MPLEKNMLRCYRCAKGWNGISRAEELRGLVRADRGSFGATLGALDLALAGLEGLCPTCALLSNVSLLTGEGP